MKIAILSRNPRLYSTQRLVETVRARGHEVMIIDVLRCFMAIARDKPTLFYNGEPVPEFDVVIPRIGASVTYYGTTVLRQLEMMGVLSLNSSLSITRSRDKLRSLQVLSRAGVGLPITGYAHAAADIPDLIHLVGGTPLVVKVLEGTQGIGVVRADTQTSAESIIEAFMGINTHIMVQEYIREAKGIDIRCFVVGGKVVASMQRKARPGEFRSNLHRGGSAQKVKLTMVERKTAVRAAAAMGLTVAGVDILRSKRGPVVMEVNSSPGLEGIESVTGRDIASLVVECLEEKYKRAQRRKAPVWDQHH